ncbi:carboxylate-amine ligase [Thiohalomonas denitrificans]|uniref:Putative glutamate--cysteine ligase 2 n=1 Tax=Thiohalomonas denitrificans TaxID=415747 RepID=A0A1G5PTI6_9GAMM|nr:YbdK family carboxylate-amine ligase [Thiohalomonas denitrificans]SCZ52742.1 carboxylate-amine ligase [Thiohalomonas denitrificans]
MRFNGSTADTIGVEYELQLLDGDSLDMADAILPLLERMSEGHAHIEPEYIQSTVEVVSRAMEDCHALESHLRERVAFIRNKCHELGLELCGGGTHPFRTRLGKVTPKPRYYDVEAETGYAGAIQMVCATHVHIGVPSGDEAIWLMRRLRPYLPVLLGLSAASPFYMGVDSGFAAYRPRILLAAHSYGTPPPLRSWPEFEAIWRAARRANVYRTFKDMHWDIRPKPEFGTVEVRIMDGQRTVHATVALAALVHSLSRHLQHRQRGHECLPELPYWAEVENAYRAAHLGLDAHLIINEHGDTRPLPDIATEMLKTIEPAARAFGETAWLESVTKMVNGGASYLRQRAVFARAGSLREVVADAVAELAEDLTRH